MNIQQRIELLINLGAYLKSDNPNWQAAKQQAELKNAWFTQEFINLAATNIANNFLTEEVLQHWVKHYALNDAIVAKNIGVVMAGNMPLVGFADFLACFICGHMQTIKLSSKDDVLLKHILQYLYSQEATLQNYVGIAERLNGCDAYIATGGDNATMVFEQYFSKYPNIIRTNKTSVAILTGTEREQELELLANDVHLYFGLGCRNVTKLFVPEGYNFEALVAAFKKFNYFLDNKKYKNNYDYNLSIALLNNQYYMSSGATLLLQNDTSIFSPISVVNYSFYKEEDEVLKELQNNSTVQCIVGKNFIPFGQAQQPSIYDYADGIDTMQFLLGL
jgi:hypothetical protein